MEDIIYGAIGLILSIGVVSVWIAYLRKVIAEIKDVLAEVVLALEDGTVTKAEVLKIIKESKEVGAAIKNLPKK